jgi:hypothetical protein
VENKVLKLSINEVQEKKRKRVVKTINDLSCDKIKKVKNAGVIFEENGEKYQIMHNGLKIPLGCYHGLWMAYIIQELKGHHEPFEEKIFHEVLMKVGKNATMLELGSFWAYYSMWFNLKIPNAVNYLIEPSISRLKIGKKNFDINNLNGIFLDGYIGDNKPKINNDIVSNNKIIIDKFIMDNKIEVLDILHSDIQGAELQMLNTAKKSMSLGKIKNFFISTHSDKIHKDCLELIKKNKYKIIFERTSSKETSGDGLIVAEIS